MSIVMQGNVLQESFFWGTSQEFEGIRVDLVLATQRTLKKWGEDIAALKQWISHADTSITFQEMKDILEKCETFEQYKQQILERVNPKKIQYHNISFESFQELKKHRMEGLYYFMQGPDTEWVLDQTVKILEWLELIYPYTPVDWGDKLEHAYNFLNQTISDKHSIYLLHKPCSPRRIP